MKYVYPVIIIFGGGIAVSFLWYQDIPGGEGFKKAFLTGYLWVLLWVIQMPFRIKIVEAGSDGVKIGTGENQKLITYENIEYVTHFHYTAPWGTTMQYKDEETNVSKKVAFLISTKQQQGFGENKMTRYIKDNMKLHIPHYDDSIHPSMVQNMLTGFLISLPVILLVIYFMKDFFTLLNLR
ncbi:MAG: hypothetical protein AAGA77_19305 [Bacteroidota bacterium]